MMNVYGYVWESKAEAPCKLCEASLVCTKEELDRFIAFLTDIRSASREMNTVEGEHWHYRDWVGNWSDRQADFIVFLTDEKEK